MRIVASSIRQRTCIFKSSGQCLETLSLSSFFLPDTVQFFLHPVIVILQVINLSPKSLNRLGQGLVFEFLLITLAFEIGDGSFKLLVQSVCIGFEFGNVETKVLAFRISFGEYLCVTELA